jgi:hypothetical protein
MSTSVEGLGEFVELKECGRNLDQNTRYAIWNWDKN